MNWLEISLTLDGELAEAVADVLAPHAHQGVAIESTAVAADTEEEGHPVGPMRVRAFLPADDPATLEATKQKIEEGLFYLNMIRPLPNPAYAFVADADWAELWKAHYKSVRVGRRLLVVPSWLADSDSDDATTRPFDQPTIRLLMDPGMAFGTGTHPTTQLCLALIESHLKPGDAVLDVGCGSGILALAAAKLGARSVLGLDIEEESVRATLENARINGVADKVESRLGSISNLQPPISNFQLTVANIIAPVIIRLLGEGLAQTLAPGGKLIVSGILQEQVTAVAAALTDSGLRILEQRHSGDWVAIVAAGKTG
jgi:ribosomal protein L11 methyltransferase